MKNEEQTGILKAKVSAVSALHPIVFAATLYQALGAVGSLFRNGESDPACIPLSERRVGSGFPLKKLFVLSSILICLCGETLGQSAAGINPVFQVGERLQYKVTWGIFRLGTITMRTARERVTSDSTAFKVSMLIESNPDLPFVSIWEYYESLLDGAALFSQRFYGRCISGDEDTEIRGVYDSASEAAFHSRQDIITGKTIMSDTLNGVSPFVEGSSLFFLARCLSHSKRVADVPTYVNGKISSTIMDFTPPVELIELDAVPHPVRVHRYTGTAHWTGGAAGLSGEFTGWLSDDEAAIPMKAEMKVILGSIRIELEQWDRVGWMPPDGFQVVNRKP